MDEKNKNMVEEHIQDIERQNTNIKFKENEVGLSFKRAFTEEDKNVLEMFEYEKRSSIIKNADGSIVYEMKDIEVPKFWSQMATDILAQKYIRKKGVPQYKDGKIVVATIQSLESMYKKNTYRFKDILSKFDVIILDECHHASAKTYCNIMYHSNAYYRFGLSGTPRHENIIKNMTLNGLTGGIIYNLSTVTAINKKLLCDISIEIVENYETISNEKYHDTYRLGIIESSTRNNLIYKLIDGNLKNKILVLVKNIAHGEILSEILNKNNIKNKWINGNNSQSEREDAINSLVNDGHVLISSGIFDEGIDIPSINVLIIASGGKSSIKAIQRIGRGLRKKEDNSSLKVYDFIDHSKYLIDHSIERITIYKNESYIK